MTEVYKQGPTPDHVDRHGTRYGPRARGMRSVLLAVADVADVDGLHAHPGIPRLAEYCLYSRRQIINILDELEADGWLIVREAGGGAGRATVYDIDLTVGNHCTLFAGQEGCNTQPEKVQSGAEKVQSTPETVQSDCTPTKTTNPTTTNARSAGFDFAGFWELWPDKRDRRHAEKAFVKAAQQRADPRVILIGLQRQLPALELAKERGFCPHASTWLNGDRWTDELTIEKRDDRETIKGQDVLERFVAGATR